MLAERQTNETEITGNKWIITSKRKLTYVSLVGPLTVIVSINRNNIRKLWNCWHKHRKT